MLSFSEAEAETKKKMGIKSFVEEILRYGSDIPDKPAYVFLGDNTRRTVLTFGEVSTLSQKFAAYLCAKGIVRGDVVCNTLPTSPERIISELVSLCPPVLSYVDSLPSYTNRHRYKKELKTSMTG